MNLRTRTARRTIPNETEQQQKKLHTAKIAQGLALGYRKGARGGSWIARKHESGTRYSFHPLGTADDHVDANGSTILTFDQAQDGARRWFERKHHEDMGSVSAGPYTVAQAMEDYIADRERAKRTSLYRTRVIVKAHILPTLGHVDVAKLTHSKIKTWRDTLADKAPHARTGFAKERVQVMHTVNGKEVTRWRMKKTATPLPQAHRKHDFTDAEATRKRQATANRVLTMLKAALNHAHAETKRISSKAAWEAVKPFRNVDVAKVRFMTAEEITKLVSHCEPSFGLLVRAALLTGCRYGELTRLVAEDFDSDTEQLFIRTSKNGESRHVELSAEGAAFFEGQAAGKAKDERLFTRANGKAWKPSEQKPPMDKACEAAGIEQVTFHILRHTYASHLAMNATPLRVIADQLGHRDTRITERHYAHLGRAYVRETIRQRMPSFGLAAA